jgi:hypothetical protein
MTKLSLLVVVSVLAGCSAVPVSYSRRDIVDAVRIVSAQRGDPSNWAASLPIEDKGYSASEASAAVRSALRERWCKTGGAPPAKGTPPASVPSTARDNANAAQLAASTPDIRC